MFPFSFTLASPTATTVTTQWVTGQPLTVVKNGVTVTLTNGGASQCSGSATCTSGDCLRSGDQITCFHASTRITYKSDDSKSYSLSELQSGHVAECHVPHVVRSSSGVRIETRCDGDGRIGSASRSDTSSDSSSSSNVLRLTGDHLVFTSRGLRSASTIVAGDVLFSDHAETKKCHVIRVEKERSEQLYFGLNCHESDVLAEGLKTSTFGHYHTIPAAWMKYGSKLLGIERTSRWGDTLAQWLSAMNFL